MSDEIQRHEMYKKLADHVYKFNASTCPKGAIPLYIHENRETGFFACAYKYKDRIVIVIRGTDGIFTKDAINDFYMKCDKIPSQTKDAIIFIKQIKEVIKRDYPGYKLDITGHSLGGSIAQCCYAIVSGINECVAFMPYGVKNILKEYLEKYNPKNSLDRMITYYAYNDIVSDICSKETQIGRCYMICRDPEIKIQHLFLKEHYLEGTKPLSTRIYMGTKKSDTESKMDNHKDISECSGSYPVKNYVRSDGTEVKDYIRRCYKHWGMSPEERQAGQEKYKGKRFQDLTNDELKEALSYFI